MLVCACVADYDGLYLMVCTKTKLGTWVIPPTASLRPSLLLYLNQPDMSHIHFAPQCGPLCSWSSGPSGSVNNRVNSRETERRATLSLNSGSRLQQPSLRGSVFLPLSSVTHWSPAVPRSKSISHLI